jgi:Flp pilus assembly protein TadB
MKNHTDNPNLSLNAAAAQEQASHNNPETERSPKRKAKRKSTKTRQSGGPATRAARESHWRRIKGRLAAKIAQLDKEKFQEVLLGCGVAVGIVASVVLAIKLMPLATLILAFLGLGIALRLWGLLPLPRPC